jgi:tRNA threonylcarbamoyl adenosine modification protein (Sua5/YciO/YrdC/YwlC family)
VTYLLDAADEEAASRAGELIRRGELVVIPTETVYGLAAAADDPVAVAAIFHAKGRPQDNPLIVHLASVADALATIPPDLHAARAVITAFAPGPITVVVPAPPWVAPEVSAGLDTVAIRVPDHPVARAVITAAGVPVAAPSANRSGRPSPTTFAMARSEMEGRVAAILDGGECPVGIESTVVDGRDPMSLRLLRPGRISAEAIRQRTGYPVASVPTGASVAEAPAFGADEVPSSGAKSPASGAEELPASGAESPASSAESLRDAALERSPGTRYRHYRPALPVIAFDHRYSLTRLAAEIDRAGGGAEVRVILGPRERAAGDGPTSAPSPPGRPPSVSSAPSPAFEVRRFPDWASCARALYREFWLAERDGIRRLYVELPDRTAEEGLYDRITRASSETLSR